MLVKRNYLTTDGSDVTKNVLDLPAGTAVTVRRVNEETERNLERREIWASRKTIGDISTKGQSFCKVMNTDDDNETTISSVKSGAMSGGLVKVREDHNNNTYQCVWNL